MLLRILILLSAVAAGAVLGAVAPQASHIIAAGVQALGLSKIAGSHAHADAAAASQKTAASDVHDGKADEHDDDQAHGHGGDYGGERQAQEGVIRMSPDRVAAAKIEIGLVTSGVLTRRLSAPGTIAPDANRIARVAAKVVGTVGELRKQLGEVVTKDDVVAVLDSREVAQAKSEYVSAQVNFELQKTLFEREQPLAERKIISENQFLRTRNTYTEAELRAGLAHQKLSALQLSDTEIAALSRQTAGLQRYELRAPIDGRIVERLVHLGTPVGGEGQAMELYVIADLSSVWIELFVPTADLSAIREGGQVAVLAGANANANAKPAQGRIVFISPILNQETRSARVVAEIDNQDMAWRPGSYVTAQIVAEEQPVALLVPRAALQTIKGSNAAFVRTPEGFEKREVALGKGDDRFVEVVSGLDSGESIAVANTFLLKAELGKADAEHAH